MSEENFIWNWEVGYEEWKKNLLQLIRRQKTLLLYCRERLEAAMKDKKDDEIQFYTKRIEELEESVKYNIDLLTEAEEYKDSSVFFITSEGKLEAVIDVPWFKREYEERKKESLKAYI